MNIQEQEKIIFLNDTRKLSPKELAQTIKQLIIAEFQKYLNIAGVDYITEFYSIERKQELLSNIQEQLKENDAQDIEELFNNQYYKILKEQQKIYKLDQEYKYSKLVQQEAEIKPKQNKKKFEKLFFQLSKTIIYIATTIFLFPLILVFIAMSAQKKTSKRR